ncbi:site-specific integrase [Flavicella sediminum]|uniref:site-specific integrase n=1 Tax=Flavicella sediminum TaxID=2585141 RepID=UPI0011206EAA|nr:site-specific integrase [Flavicella sediminum]
MASLNFFLRNKSTLNETPISLKILLPNKKDLVYSTGLKIAPKYWDSKNQKVRNKIEVEGVKDLINIKLAKIKSYTENEYLKLKVGNELSKENVKEKLDVFFQRRSSKVVVAGFYQYIDLLIENSKKRVAKVTWQSYERTLDLIKSFESSLRYKISFESINIEFYYAFVAYLEDSHEMSPNTIGKHLKNIKMFMNSALEDGFTKCSGHRHKYFKVLKEDSFQVYLTNEELKKIELLELKFDSIDDRVRDLFLIGAFTGQRISDWKKLVAENIQEFNGKRCFVMKQTKTNTDVIIPIHPIIEKILLKRNGKSPKFVNEQDINLTIKEIAEKAEIKELIRQKDDKPKHTLISSHSARRSFCSNAYKSGMDSLAIMQLSGHKTEKSFLTYIKISKEEFAERISNHKFFKN